MKINLFSLRRGCVCCLDNTNQFSLFEVGNLLYFSMFTQIEAIPGLLTLYTRDMTNLEGLKPLVDF